MPYKNKRQLAENKRRSWMFYPVCISLVLNKVVVWISFLVMEGYIDLP